MCFNKGILGRCSLLHKTTFSERSQRTDMVCSSAKLDSQNFTPYNYYYWILSLALHHRSLLSHTTPHHCKWLTCDRLQLLSASKATNCRTWNNRVYQHHGRGHRNSLSPAWLIARVSLHTLRTPVINRHTTPREKHFHQNMFLVTFFSWWCSSSQQVPADLPQSVVTAVPQSDKWLWKVTKCIYTSLYLSTNLRHFYSEYFHFMLFYTYTLQYIFSYWLLYS